MSEKRIVHVIGTGTIGEPLIGLFSSLREDFSLDEVTFHKRTPLSDERSKVNSLIRRGGKLVVEADRVEAFETLGHTVSYTAKEAIERATVVIDCTPCGNENKAQYLEEDGPKGFLAQGSEYGFGQMYARGLNDDILDTSNRFTHIVSCNTHNICVLIKSLAGGETHDLSVCDEPRTSPKPPASFRPPKSAPTKTLGLAPITPEMPGGFSRQWGST
jgi:glyceraldehyde-3-phosphate dehydrogenase/erythrose-4-phosphate dehydrogenase